MSLCILRLTPLHSPSDSLSLSATIRAKGRTAAVFGWVRKCLISERILWVPHAPLFTSTSQHPDESQQ